MDKDIGNDDLVSEEFIREVKDYACSQSISVEQDLSKEVIHEIKKYKVTVHTEYLFTKEEYADYLISLRPNIGKVKMNDLIESYETTIKSGDGENTGITTYKIKKNA